MFELIYMNRIIGIYHGIPIVGETIMGHIVWEVDFEHKYAYLTD